MKTSSATMKVLSLIALLLLVATASAQRQGIADSVVALLTYSLFMFKFCGTSSLCFDGYKEVNKMVST